MKFVISMLDGDQEAIPVVMSMTCVRSDMARADVALQARPRPSTADDVCGDCDKIWRREAFILRCNIEWTRCRKDTLVTQLGPPGERGASGGWAPGELRALGAQSLGETR